MSRREEEISRPHGRRRNVVRRVTLGTRGGSILEYIMLVGVLALAAIYGFRQARARENHAIAQQARIIRTLDPSGQSDPEWTDPEWGDDWTKPVCNELGYCTVPGQCFAAGTLVATQTGLVPIETLREGDLVLSRDEKSGDVALRPVVKRFVTTGQAVIDLNIATLDGGETIRATSGHPFWVTGRGWVPAVDLASNEQLWSPSGEPLHVATLTTPTAVRYETVYNFEIAEYHTYFVGHHGMWVHNGGPSAAGPPLYPCQKPGAAPPHNGNIVVIGRQVDTHVAKDWKGYDVLDIPDWNIAKNDAWVQAAIDRKATIYLGSPQNPGTLWDSVNNRPTVFARELEQLRAAGYVQVGDYMIPPP